MDQEPKSAAFRLFAFDNFYEFPSIRPMLFSLLRPALVRPTRCLPRYIGSLTTSIPEARTEPQTSSERNRFMQEEKTDDTLLFSVRFARQEQRR